MKLSIIIPVFNEAATIGEVIRSVIAINLPWEKEIIVVDDGSSDDTVSQLTKEIKGKKNIKLIQHEKNQGKGAAVRTGIGQAKGDYVLVQDADTEYNPKDIVKLLLPVDNGRAEVVYGTRLKRLPNFAKDERTFQFLSHYFGNKFLSLLTSILYGQWITDMETGYKLFPLSLAKKLKLTARSFDFEPEITAKILKTGKRIVEVPISTNPRGYKEGKKLHTVRDGSIALWTLLKYRFVN